MNLHRISPVATQSQHSVATTITQALIDQKAVDARQSERQRDIHVLHTGPEDTLHRMLNAMQPGTYITPHRHTAVPKAEAVVVLQGSLGFISFNDAGHYRPQDFIYVNPVKGIWGVDYRAGVWHTFLALAPDTVIFEVKPGPYNAATDKEFAPWAPPEGDPRAHKYLAQLEDQFRQHFSLPER